MNAIRWRSMSSMIALRSHFSPAIDRTVCRLGGRMQTAEMTSVFTRLETNPVHGHHHVIHRKVGVP